MLRIFLLIAVGLVPLNGAFAEYTTGAERLESEHELSMDYETPHTQWAKPYAQGTTRVLYVAPYYQGSTEGRELIELKQRFDLEADMVYFQRGPNRLLGDGNTRWYVTDAVGTERVLRLLEEPYDVIFLNQVALTELNDLVKAALAKAVVEGAGLVYVGKEEVWAPGPLALVDNAIAVRDAQKFATCGRGRVVHLAPRDAIEFEYGWEGAVDRAMEQQGRALLWAADRYPDAQLQFQRLVPTEAAKELLHTAQGQPLPDVLLGLSWSDVPDGSRLAGWTVRDAGVVNEPIDHPVTASGTIPVPRPRSYARDHRIDATLWRDGKIEAWASFDLPAAPGRIQGRLTLTADAVELGGNVTGAFQVSEAGPGGRLQLRLLDRDNRNISEQFFTVAGEESIPFSFEVKPWFPMLLWVEASVFHGDVEEQVVRVPVRITQRKQDQFNLIMWNVPTGDLAPYGIERMAQLGVTTILQGGPPPLALSASNLTYVPYAASFRASSHTVTAMLDDEGILKTGCVHDEVAMSRYVADVVDRAREAREHGTYVYSLGDENAVRASCLGPDCLIAYREYLQSIYGDIKALNASWETNYTGFDDISLMTDAPLPAEDAPRWFKEFFAQRTLKNQTDSETSGEEQIRMGDINDEIRALQEENYARWYDRQAFQSWTYVQWCKRFIEAFREIDPQSLTGFEGTDSFSIRRLTTRSRQGGDLDLFMREMEYFGPYRGPANEVTRSLAKPGFPAGNWIGYSRDPDVLLMNYWKQVLDNMCAVQWWRWDNMGEEYQPFLAPTLSPIGAAKEFMEDTRVIREGLGDLLMYYTMETHQIAMLYSMPSTHIAHFDGNRSYGNLDRDHNRWHEAIHNAGLQFDYVTDRQLRLGEFDASKYKVLILAEAFALGEKEAAVIRDFVAKGGTVIADVRPGLYSDRCKPYEVGILDDLFGVTRTGKQDAMAIDRMRIQGSLNDTDVYMEWGNWYGKNVYPQMHVDPTVELTTGEALGWSFPIHFHGGLKHPAGVVNEHGKGKAVLLNFSVYQAPFDSLLRELLAASGVEAPIQVHARQGQAAKRPQFAGRNDGEIEVGDPVRLVGEAARYPEGLEVSSWSDGDTELLALLADHSADVRVTLPEARIVYDLRNRKPIGKTHSFEASLKKSRPGLYALLPDAVTSVALNFSVPHGEEGSTQKVGIVVSGMSGTGVVKLSLRKPDGSPASWMPSRVLTENGVGTVTIPFGINPAKGTWVLEATDLLSGATATGEINFE